MRSACRKQHDQGAYRPSGRAGRSRGAPRAVIAPRTRRGQWRQGTAVAAKLLFRRHHLMGAPWCPAAPAGAVDGLVSTATFSSARRTHMRAAIRGDQASRNPVAEPGRRECRGSRRLAVAAIEMIVAPQAGDPLAAASIASMAASAFGHREDFGVPRRSSSVRSCIQDRRIVSRTQNTITSRSSAPVKSGVALVTAKMCD